MPRHRTPMPRRRSSAVAGALQRRLALTVPCPGLLWLCAHTQNPQTRIPVLESPNASAPAKHRRAGPPPTQRAPQSASPRPAKAPGGLRVSRSPLPTQMLPFLTPGRPRLAIPGAAPPRSSTPASTAAAPRAKSDLVHPIQNQRVRIDRHTPSSGAL